jgi:hypothetical protein
MSVVSRYGFGRSEGALSGMLLRICLEIFRKTKNSCLDKG